MHITFSAETICYEDDADVLCPKIASDSTEWPTASGDDADDSEADELM